MMSQPGNDDPKAQVQDYFSRTAESYVASFSHKAGSDLERLIELGEWDIRQQALDIATGAGSRAPRRAGDGHGFDAAYALPLEDRNYFICRSPLLMDFAFCKARTFIIR